MNESKSFIYDEIPRNKLNCSLRCCHCLGCANRLADSLMLYCMYFVPIMMMIWTSFLFILGPAILHPRAFKHSSWQSKYTGKLCFSPLISILNSLCQCGIFLWNNMWSHEKCLRGKVQWSTACQWNFILFFGEMTLWRYKNYLQSMTDNFMICLRLPNGLKGIKIKSLTLSVYCSNLHSLDIFDKSYIMWQICNNSPLLLGPSRHISHDYYFKMFHINYCPLITTVMGMHMYCYFYI